MRELWGRGGGVIDAFVMDEEGKRWVKNGLRC